MRFLVASIVASIWMVSCARVEARVAVEIDLATQTMHVRSGSGTYAWPVSTARTGYVTPRGRYRPTVLKRMHYSRKYDMSPMPHSIFFAGGYAIHGTYEMRSLGRPASHGCIRLAPSHAARLFEMVREEGATITISGRPPITARRSSTARMARPPASPAYRDYEVPYGRPTWDPWGPYDN